jgi:iron complex outermembrane receptor protein
MNNCNKSSVLRHRDDYVQGEYWPRENWSETVMNAKASLLATVFTIGGVLLPKAMLAQPAGPATATHPASAASSENIVVTATKRSERLRDIPVTVTALSARQMQIHGIKDLMDIANYTPGLKFTDFLDKFNGNVTIRGLQQTNVQNAIGNVGVFLDGIYLQRGYMVDTKLGDYDRVEVVKGPQSALYGQNTFAGAVNYVTRQPTDTLHGDATFTAGNGGLFEEKAGVGGPLIKGMLDARIYWAQSVYDGTWKNNYPDASGRSKYFGGYNDHNLSASFKFTPTENLTVTGSYYTLHRNEQPRPFYTIDGNLEQDHLNCGDTAANGSFDLWCGALPNSPTGVQTGKGNPLPALSALPQPGTQTTTKVVRATADYKLPYDFDLNYTFGNAAGTALEEASFAANAYDKAESFLTSGQKEAGTLNYYSNEVRLVYHGDFPLTGEIGYFDSRADDKFLFGLRLFPTGQLTLLSLPGGILSSAGVTDVFTDQFTRYNTESEFGRLTYKALGGRLRFNAEARYGSTSITDDDLLARSANPSLPMLHATYDDFTPRFSAQYFVTPQNMVYASAARGVKAGGFNGYSSGDVVLTKAEQSFGEEKNWTYELGWKGSLINKRLNFAADFFYVDWENKEIAVPVSFGTSTIQGAGAVPSIYASVGNAYSYGFEFNGDYEVVDGLTLSAAFSYQNPRLAKGAVISAFSAYCDNIVCSRSGNVGGNEIGLVSELAGTGSVEYTGNFAFNPQISYFMGADEIYRGGQYTDESNTAQIPEYWLTDAHAGLKYKYFTAFLWVKNMFDKEYVESSFVVPSILQYNVDLGERRTFGITLTAGF